MMTNRTLLDDFVRKQRLSKEDKNVQINCIYEEVAELSHASMFETEHRELEEGVDVLVAVVAYMRMIGFSWDVIAEEVERKMLVNVDKPPRKEIGVKVKKE